MAAALTRVRRLAVGLVGAGLVLLLIGHGLGAAASVSRIFGRHAGVALSQERIVLTHAAAVQGSLPRRVRPVPRILHQVFHGRGNESMPADWAAMRKSCLELHPTWEHKLWNESASRHFIQTEYPWFLDAYNGFRFPVQRVDTLRYFLVRHFGGVYMDLENGCRASLEPLLYYPAWVTDGGNGTLGNSIIGGEPEHPFWILMTDSLVAWASHYVLPYITINYATGRWYETEMWQIYHHRKPQRSPDLHRVMLGAPPWIFFTGGRGGTWHDWDSRPLTWMSNHVLEILLYALGSLGAIFAVIITAKQALRRRWGRLRVGEWEQMRMLG